MRLYKSQFSFGIYFSTPIRWFMWTTTSSLCALSSSFSGPELSHFLSTKPCIPSFIIYQGEWHLHPPSCPRPGLKFSVSPPLASMTPHLISHEVNSPSSQYMPFFSAWHPPLLQPHLGPSAFFTGIISIAAHCLSWFQSCPSNLFSKGFFSKCKSDQAIPVFKSLQCPGGFWEESNFLACCSRCFMTTGLVTPSSQIQGVHITF